MTVNNNGNGRLGTSYFFNDWGFKCYCSYNFIIRYRACEMLPVRYQRLKKKRHTLDMLFVLEHHKNELV